MNDEWSGNFDALLQLFRRIRAYSLPPMAFVGNSIAADVETTWFEAVLLVAVHSLLGIAFYFARP